jgi:CDP-glucose 4,6-dehydratase
VVVSRCANVYGGGDLNYSRLVPGTIRSALLGERPLIRSNGTPIRDYVFIEDVVDAYLLLGEHALESGIIGSAFNFGANRPISVLGLVDLILQACDRSDLQPQVAGEGKLAQEIDEQYLDSARAESSLGWSAATTLKDGLQAAVSWYHAHIDLLSPRGGPPVIDQSTGGAG